jgi:hypothetical protein
MDDVLGSFAVDSSSNSDKKKTQNGIFADTSNIKIREASPVTRDKPTKSMASTRNPDMWNTQRDASSPSKKKVQLEKTNYKGQFEKFVKTHKHQNLTQRIKEA